MVYLFVFLKDGCILFALQGSHRNAGLEIVPNKDVSRRTEKVMFVPIVCGEGPGCRGTGRAKRYFSPQVLLFYLNSFSVLL